MRLGSSGPFGIGPFQGLDHFLLRDLTSSGSGLLKTLPFKGWPASKIGIGLLALEGLDPCPFKDLIVSPSGIVLLQGVGPFNLTPSRIGIGPCPSGPFGDRTLSGVGPFPPQGFDFFREWTS